MTMLVSDCRTVQYPVLISLVFQVFEDGSTYRGRLKFLGRTIVKSCYENILNPNIMEDHNSDQASMIVRDNVAETLRESTFLLAAELDENVSFKNNSHAND